MSARTSLTQWLAWLAEFRPALPSLGLALVTAALLLIVHPTQEIYIRWWGGALQLVGIYAVVHELWSTQKHFGLLGVLGWFRGVIARRPGANVSVAVSGAALMASAASLHGRARVTPKAGATLDERVDRLERNAGNVDAELDELHRKADAEQQERKQADQAEASERKGSVTAVEERLKKAATGSVPFSLVGVWWLAVGVVLATASQELAQSIGR